MRTFLLTSIAALLAIPGLAATRLTYSMADRAVPVFWPTSSFPLRYQVDRRLMKMLPEGTVDRAIALWTSIPDSTVQFDSPQIADGLGAGFDGKNAISVVDDLFRDQRAIALTTNWYDANGHLLEADIQVDASLAGGSYNAQQILAHEVGHVLGLDHSAVLSAVMFPYVSKGTETPQLDSDDRVAMAALYPRQADRMIGGILQGRVVGEGGGVFAAQVVAVSESGEPVATGLTNAAGEFELRGIPPGRYRLYAEPLDGPVDTRNLDGVWRQAKVTSFATQFVDRVAEIGDGQVIGHLIVDTAGPPVQLNPKWVGVGAANADTFKLGTAVGAVKPGQTIALAVAGDGMTSGMTTFEVLNPGIRQVSPFRYGANYVYANFEVGASAPAGSAVIVVKSGLQTAALTGALRIQGASARSRSARH